MFGGFLLYFQVIDRAFHRFFVSFQSIGRLFILVLCLFLDMYLLGNMWSLSPVTLPISSCCLSANPANCNLTPFHLEFHEYLVQLRRWLVPPSQQSGVRRNTLACGSALYGIYSNVIYSWVRRKLSQPRRGTEGLITQWTPFGIPLNMDKPGVQWDEPISRWKMKKLSQQSNRSIYSNVKDVFVSPKGS